jgi:signal transduction histidine kinase
MRLAEFILTSMEPILAEWETFARGIWPAGAEAGAAGPGPRELRDHAEDILRAVAADMATDQSAGEQSEKSMGADQGGGVSRRLNGASDVHAVGRVESGFGLLAVVAEYRALRAAVIRLWHGGTRAADPRDVNDLIRFNESIDQSLAKAVQSYTQRVDRSRQLFLAILGHDLRNPLNSIMMSADLLGHTRRGDADGSEAASRIASSAAAMGRMIGDLLDFTGAALGAEMPLARAPADVGGVCGEVVDEMRAAYPTRTVRFAPDGELSGEWDAARLRQLVSNLLGNAIQHGASDGPVDLSVAGEVDEVVIAVHNGGAPIPPDAVATIFDPLVRGSTPELQRQRRPGSIGLGLYIARAVATAHGGTIDVTSTAGAGTTLTVRLPRQRTRPR